MTDYQTMPAKIGYYVYNNLISQILKAGQFCIDVYQYLQKLSAQDIWFLLKISAL